MELQGKHRALVPDVSVHYVALYGQHPRRVRIPVTVAPALLLSVNIRTTIRSSSCTVHRPLPHDALRLRRCMNLLSKRKARRPETAMAWR